MRKILYIGGVGSDSHMVDGVARVLESKFNANVIAMGFGDAYMNKAKIARLAPECTVITHSAGMLLLKDTAPKEVIAVAPPMPTPPSLILLRSFPKTMALLTSSRECIGRPRKVASYHLHSFKAHLLKPASNSLLLRSISMFDAARCAVELQRCGATVTLGFMDNDRLFPDSHLHPHIEVAKKQGVKVSDVVLGQHDEFVLYPLEVLAQMGY